MVSLMPFTLLYYDASAILWLICIVAYFFFVAKLNFLQDLPTRTGFGAEG